MICTYIEPIVEQSQPPSNEPESESDDILINSPVQEQEQEEEE